MNLHQLLLKNSQQIRYNAYVTASPFTELLPFVFHIRTCKFCDLLFDRVGDGFCRRPLTPPDVRLSNNSKIQSDIDGIFIFDFFNTIFIFVFHMNYICSSPCYITLSSNFVTNSSVENMLNNRLKL